MIFKIILLVLLFSMLNLLSGILVKCFYNRKSSDFIDTSIYGLTINITVFMLAFVFTRFVINSLLGLSIVYGVLQLCFLIVGGFFYREEIPVKVKELFNYEFNVYSLILAVVLVLMTTFFVFVSMYMQTPEERDSIYNVMQATQMLKEKKVSLEYNMYTGTEEKTKFCISAIAAFIAMIANITGLKAVEVANNFMPVVSIVAFVMINYVILKALGKYSKNRYVLLGCFASMIYMFFSCVGANHREMLFTSLMMCPWDSAVIAVMLIFIALLYKKRKQNEMVAILIFDMLVIIGGMITEKISISNFSYFWNSYIGQLKFYAVNVIKTPVISLIILAFLIIYMYEESHKVRVYLLKNVVIILVVALNPLTYWLYSNFIINSDINHPFILMWVMPVYTIVGYVFMKIFEKMDYLENIKRNKIIFCAGFLLLNCLFGVYYGANFEWEHVKSRDHIKDSVKQIMDVIDEFSPEGDKRIIALEELTQDLRLYDGNVEIYYYDNNKFPLDEDNTEVYTALNQDNIYLMPIARAAKTHGYNYIITRPGVLYKAEELITYDIYYVGSTDEYEIYTIGF